MPDRTRRHGTAYSYRKGCRCDDCAQAKRDEMRRARAKSAADTVGLKHGTPWAYYKGCRCLDCGLARRREQLRVKFRLTLERHDELLAAQGGACAICGKPPNGKRLAVDHDHACCPGKKSCGACVRGLLCDSCNGAIALLRDDPQLAIRAAAYLSR